MSNNAWTDVPVGTIVDSDMTALATAGELITGDFHLNCVKQACYELRASEVFWDVASAAEDKRVVVGAGGAYLLKPNCYVVSIVKERINLPDNVLARILTKGKLFSIGLLPVNTYADPGFEGRLGITLYNGSRRYIQIRPGEPIAKIEFVKLAKSVQHPYNGQHGYETEIWPIATQMFANSNDEWVTNLTSNDSAEIEQSFGPRIAKLARELRFYGTKVWLQVFLILGTFVVLLAVKGYVSVVWSLGLGVAANLLTILGTNLLGRLKHWNV